MLQYNSEAGTWTQIGRLQKGRYAHAIAEANLGAVGCSGNRNQENRSHKHHYHLGAFSGHINFKHPIGSPKGMTQNP